MRRRPVQRWVGVVAMATAVVGCRPRAQTFDVTTPAVASTPAPAKTGRRGPVASPAVTAATSPVQLLPDTTRVVFTAAGLQALLGMVDIDAIVGKYRSQYDQAAAELVRTMGVNLLDPAQWTAVGLDASGPMGVALAEMRSETIVAYVTLSDRDKFRALLDKLSKGTLVPVLEDRGLVLKSNPDDDSAIVLRDRYAFYVSQSRPARATYDHARSLATIDPARSLTATPRYQQAMISDEPARPLTAYVDAWGLIEDEYSQSAQVQDREPSWAEMELERAQTSGAPQDELERLRRQVDDDRRWEEQRRQKRITQYDVISRWFRDVGPIVFEFTADKAGVTGRVRSRMPETSIWRTAVRNTATPSPVLMALAERPVMLIGGSLDVVAAKALLDDLMRSSGADPAKEYAEFKAETSVDFERDLVPLLTGTGGFAMTVSEALLRGDYKKSEQEMGFAAALGVNSPQRAQALVDAAVQRVPRAKLGRERKTGAHTLEIADYRVVYVAVVAGQIVVTTDLGVIQRLSTGAQGSLAKVLASAAVPLVTARDTAGQGMFDLFYPVFMFFGRRSSAPAMRPEEPYSLFPEVPRARIDKVARSRAYKAKLREWESTDAKIRREEEAEEKRQTKVVTAVADAIGVQAWHLREQPDGLTLTGGHYFGKGGLTRAIDSVAEYVGQGRRSEKLWEMYSARSTLEGELRRIRVGEVALALGVPTPL